MARSESYLELSGSNNPNDIMRWPDPADPEEVEWRLHHHSYPILEDRRRDERVAASYMNAYRALIAMPQRLRNQRIEQIKRASVEAEKRRQEATDA